MRRACAVLAIVTGAVLVGWTFVQHLPTRSADAEKISDHYRGLMSAGGLAELRAGFNGVKAAAAELQGKALPQLQHQLGLSDADFATYVRANLSGVSQFADQAPAVVGLVEPVIGRMEDARRDYHSSDQIPVGFLPLTAAPWLFLLIGGGLVGVGTWLVLARDQSARTPLAVLGVIALVMAVGPLVFRIPSKIDAAVRLTALGRVGLAPSTGQKAVGATALFDALASDVKGKLEPALGPTDFHQNFPALDAFTTSWQSSISAKSHALSDSQVALAPVFANADRIALRPVPWLFILPGLALLVGIGAAQAKARLRPVPPPVVAPA